MRGASTQRQRSALARFIDGLSRGATAIRTYAEILMTLQSKNADVIARAIDVRDAAASAFPPTCPDLSAFEEDHAEYMRQARRAAHECAALLGNALHVERTVLKTTGNGEPYAISPRRRLSESEIEGIIASIQDGGRTLDIDDFAQGSIGDCYFLAALRAILGTPNGKEFIVRNVVAWPSESNCQGFMVTLYDDPANPDENHKRTVFVDSAYIRGVSRDDTTEFNIYSVYEAAYGQYREGVDERPTPDYLGAGLGARAMHDITGGGIVGIQTNIPGYPGDGFMDSPKAAELLVKAGLPVTVTTNLLPEEKEEKYVDAEVPGQPDGVKVKIPQAHVYTVVDADDTGITLHNPWGYNDLSNTPEDSTEEPTFTLTWEEFQNSYLTLDVGGPIPND